MIVELPTWPDIEKFETDFSVTVIAQPVKPEIPDEPVDPIVHEKPFVPERKYIVDE